MSLPDRPNLRHLKDQAKDLLRSGGASSLTDALFKLARTYGFASWSKLRAHVVSLQETGKLAQAIDADDVERVKAMLLRNPTLHQAPIGYGGSPALTRVAECRPLHGPPGRPRLDMAAWMIDHGSDVHQDGDAPLGRAALYGIRIPMMELLVARGADVNASAKGPIIMSPCETVDPVALKWLLDRGANPNCAEAGWGTALDYVLGSYVRTRDLSACIDVLLAAGAETRYDVPIVLAMLRARLDDVEEQMAGDASLVSQHFPQLEFGVSGGRMLTLRGATLLHVAAEYDPTGRLATLCLQRGADVNARALVGEDGVGGQTAIFHAVSHGNDQWLALTRLLLDRHADVNVRAKVPGYYERPDEVLDCTPLGYALQFSGSPDSAIVRLLRERGAVE